MLLEIGEYTLSVLDSSLTYREPLLSDDEVSWQWTLYDRIVGLELVTEICINDFFEGFG